MAARKPLTKIQQDQVREAIRTSQLANRLQAFALEETDAFGNVVDIDPNRLKAIEILLRKTLPDLKAIEHTGEITQNVVSAKPMTAEEWAAEHGGDE